MPRAILRRPGAARLGSSPAFEASLNPVVPTIMQNHLYAEPSSRLRGSGDEMNIDSIREFIVLAQCPSITKASQKLHLSHQNLNRHLIEIERELGCSLLVRKPSLQLTVFGEVFLKSAIGIVNQYDDSQKEIRSLARAIRGSIKVLVFEMIPFITLIAEVRRRLHEKYPGVEIELSRLPNISTDRALKENSVDVGFMFNIGSERSELPHVLSSTQSELGYRRITAHTANLLFADSRRVCEESDCSRELTDEDLMEANSWSPLTTATACSQWP